MNNIFKNSLFSKNRKTPDIVYPSCVDEQSTRITLEAFLAENPSLSEEDFKYWKKLLRDDWEKLYNHDRKEGERHSSLDDEMCGNEWMEKFEDTLLLGIAVQSVLTQSEARRLVAYHLAGYSQKEIAESEGVHQSVISRCIAMAQKKLKYFLKQ